jgi:exodeoxyribonuclease III
VLHVSEMMKLFSWNVNGVRAVVKKGSLQQVVKDYAPDILCLQETKAERGQAEVDVSGYSEYWHSAVKRGYSGTAIFTKAQPLKVVNGLPEAIIEQYDLAEDGYGDPNSEGRVIAAEYDGFWVVTVYTPNAKGDLSRLELRHTQWDPAFLAYCKELEQTKPVIFCGDLNVAHTELDLANPKPNEGKNGFTREEREGFQAFIDAGFVDTFRLFKQGNGYYTWWSPFANARARNVGWRIDYVMVSESLRPMVMDADIYPAIMGSDHCPISVKLAM